MTDIQIPAALLDLFAAFNIADPAQVLILLLSGILVLLLVLIIIIAARGRSVSYSATTDAASSNSNPSSSAEPASPSPADPATDRAEPVAAPADADRLTDSDQLEDFRIFKRPKAGAAKLSRSATPAPTDEQLSTADHLRLIEKNMIRLRDLYQGGHITRDMYVDETRSLYHQARGLSSIS